MLRSLDGLSIVVGIVLALTVSGCGKRAAENHEPNEAAAAESLPGPQYAARLICYNGAVGSDSSCSMTFYDPNDGTHADAMRDRQMVCGFPGRVSRITWTFLERQENRDVYGIRRVFPADLDKRTSTHKTVAFEGKQVIVFQETSLVCWHSAP